MQIVLKFNQFINESLQSKESMDLDSMLCLYSNGLIGEEAEHEISKKIQDVMESQFGTKLLYRGRNVLASEYEMPTGVEGEEPSVEAEQFQPYYAVMSEKNIKYRMLFNLIVPEIPKTQNDLLAYVLTGYSEAYRSTEHQESSKGLSTERT